MFSHSQLYRLRYQHQTLSELVSPFTEEQLRLPVNPGKWSVLENVAHLAAYQPVFLERIATIQHRDEPEFGRYVAENDPAFPPMTRHSIGTILEHLAQYRERIIQELESIDESRLKRVGIHLKYGRMDIVAWTEFFLLHEAHHLFTIFMLTAELRKTQE
ncbi:MAG TPA: DinB family protein [Chitinophagaceae bacterium]